MPELPADLSYLSLDDVARLVADRRLPPVESWTPARVGDSDMRIARDGTWYHQGGPIRRENMVRLFSTLLRRDDDGRYALVTPVEKLFIEVEDTPFLAVEVKSEGAGQDRTLVFRLITGDLIVAGRDHPVRFEGSAETPRPLLRVRGGMDARIDRAPFYALADWALEEAQMPLGIWSQGCFFEIPTT